MTNKFSFHNYVNLPNEVKSNYEGQFPSNFTNKVTELWEEEVERKDYRNPTKTIMKKKKQSCRRRHQEWCPLFLPHSIFVLVSSSLWPVLPMNCMHLKTSTGECM